MRLLHCAALLVSLSVVSLAPAQPVAAQVQAAPARIIAPARAVRPGSAIYSTGGTDTLTTANPDLAPAMDDELRLRAAGLATDGATLLHFFRQRALPSVEPRTVVGLIDQ